MADGTADRVLAALGGVLALENVRPVHPGIARATQLLRIGAEVICSDEVLVEEVHYDSMDRMATEITSLTIKMGMFSPFERRSTYPPKYFFAGEHTPIAYFVTSVPQVSLDAILIAMNETYPPHYTWDQVGFLRDRAKVLIGVLQESWKQAHNPFRVVSAMVAAMKTRHPQRISRHERMQLAAFLAVSLRQKHNAGIYHNNISAHTVFFTDALSPRLLNNYSGAFPLFRGDDLPPQLHNRPADDPFFGEQSADVYALALLTCRLLLGETIDGCAFQLDNPADGPGNPQHDSIAHRKGWQAAFNTFIDLANEMHLQAVRSWHWVRSLLDQTCWPRFRRLCRASGPLAYSLPFIGPFLCICFPPRTAVVLRAILDQHYNEAAFVVRGRSHRPHGTIRNADCSFLLSGLSGQWFHRSSRIALFIQSRIDAAKRRPVETADDDRLAPRSRAHGRVMPALRWAAALLLLALTFMLYDSDAIISLYGNSPKSAGVRAARKGPAVRAVRRDPASQPSADRARITQKLTARSRAAKNRQVLPVQRRVAEQVSAQRKQTLKDVARERDKPPCIAELEPVPGYSKVLKIVNMGPGCRAGDIRLDAGNGKTRSLLELAGVESKWYLMHPRGKVMGDIIIVRLCRYADESHIEGRFYEALGTQGLGREIPVEEGDLFAFNWLVLNRYKNKR